VALSVVASVLFSRVTYAGDAPKEEDVKAASEAFTRGVALSREQKWGEALEAFDLAATKKKHSLTTYNRGVAERALAHFTRARLRFAEALAENEAAGGKELAQIDGLLVHLDITLDPADAALVVDGRPIQWIDDKQTVAYAGVAPPGELAPVGKAAFELVLDPGPHVFTVTKEGHEPVIHTETLKGASRAPMRLSVIAMPARLRITATQFESAVRIQDLDVGFAPVTIERPAGDYQVDVRKSGYVTYTTKVTLKAGQPTELNARLTPDPPFYKRVWFWAGVGAALVAGYITVVAINYDDSYSGGSTGWVASPR
jgi:hypothetical protein